MVKWLWIIPMLIWVTGLAVLIATISYHDWAAAATGCKFRQRFEAMEFQIPFSTGLTLVAIGLMLTDSPWWERLIWLWFASFFSAQLWRQWRRYWNEF